MTGQIPLALARATRGTLRSEVLRYERLLHEAWAACDQVAAEGDTGKATRYDDRFLLRLGEYEAIVRELRRRG